MKLKKNKIVYWGGVIFMGIFSIRLSTNVWRLWRAGDRIKQAEQEVRKQELENSELQKRLAEVQSPEFIKKEAREKLGLGREGEEIIVLPPQNAMPNTQYPISNEPNWKRWWKVYMGLP